jgi:hypothetical protein
MLFGQTGNDYSPFRPAAFAHLMRYHHLHFSAYGFTLACRADEQMRPMKKWFISFDLQVL